MPYATGRVFCDADSHLMETNDWLITYADPAVRDRLAPLNLTKGGAAPEQAIVNAVARQKDPVETEKIRHGVIAGPKGWAAYGAFSSAERSRALDDLGFSRQLVFTTFAATQFMHSSDPEVIYGGARAHNRAVVDFCSADKRLIPVGMISLEYPDRALEEVNLAIKLGCGAVWISASPAGDKSPGHPDLDPFWARLAEAGVPFMLHIGLSMPVLPPAYHNYGRPLPKDIHGGGENIRVRDFMVISFAPQMFLAALVFDGVFDRFPNLRGGVIELGASWVPDFLDRMDRGARIFRGGDPNIEALSLLPSEFIRRQVKFTPFAGEDVGSLINRAGSELFLFSSDFPHPEGTPDPLGRFEKSLAAASEDVKERFYHANFETMMGLA